MEVEGGWGAKPKAHNPSEGCRWKTAVKNNRRRETLLNQPQKSLILPEGDGIPRNPSHWEEESKTGSTLWRETWCKNRETPRGMEDGTSLVLTFWVRSPDRLRP